MAMEAKPSVLVCLRTLSNSKVTSNFIETCLSRLRNCFQVVFLDDIQQNPSIKNDIAGIVTPGPDSKEINKLIRTLPNLKVISNHGMGVDNLDLKWAKEKGLRVGNTKYVIADSTAELAITLMLLSTRKIVQGVRMAMGKEHPNFVSPSLLGISVTKKNLGIVGMGDIGLKIALRATAFGMKILYHNRTQRSKEDEERVKATYYPRLHDMLPETDVLVIACPCTEQTINLISTEEFRLMKKTSLLVNIARGKIVDTDALVKALQSNEIQSAAMDVTEPEPLPRGHPLLSMPNVVITPHCGTYTFETRLEMIGLVIENLNCALAGKAMPSEVIL
ncbi:probable 2-ketogluconate reductase isoform X1 [Octopus sinensis]|uniref:Probable 2-ketogluconate reductase isoform X1 n=1 Tax=Octopus sinensis TaxID=2607531 RepID=A0A6P7TB85_9MOLL|nr:probable 2-ketogluconate reductase isoform X1 [Octopus sinensis]